MKPTGAEAYPLLFSSLCIGRRVAKNRIVSTAHATGYGVNGHPTDRYIQYHALKAKGGAGIVMMFGSSGVHPTSPSADWGGIAYWDDAVVPSLSRMAEAIHHHGALAIAQMSHRGRRGITAFSGSPLLAPSAIPEAIHREIPHAMSRADIVRMVKAFATAARRIQQGGFDGIEILMTISHLIGSFWSPLTNRRADEYGGSLENRMRFAVEVVEAVRDAVGPDCIIGARLTGEEREEGGLSQFDLLEIAGRLSQLKRIDYFSVISPDSTTLRGQAAVVPSMYYPLGVNNRFAAHLKAVVGVPVVVAGRILHPDQAEEVLARGWADLVGMTRAMIADPELPRKIQEGRLEDIRPCVGANEGCIGRLYQGLPITCIHNPVIGREAELAEIRPAIHMKKVVVVGGGPAGLEAARVAALRGHRVVLFEQTARLGGQVLVAARAPLREVYADIARWLIRQVEKVGVTIHLETTATRERIEGEHPDAVIVATGSVPRIPDLPGVTRPEVTTVNDVLLARVMPGRRCVVIDEEGHMRAPSAAEALVDQGREVEIVTRLYTVGEDLDPTLKVDLYAHLFGKGVAFTPNTEVREVIAGGLRVRHVFSGQERLIPADTVVLAYGGQAVDGLSHELAGVVPEIHLVGDALAPRRLHDALLEGTRAARAL